MTVLKWAQDSNKADKRTNNCNNDNYNKMWFYYLSWLLKTIVNFTKLTLTFYIALLTLK